MVEQHTAAADLSHQRLFGVHRIGKFVEEVPIDEMNERVRVDVEAKSEPERTIAHQLAITGAVLKRIKVEMRVGEELIGERAICRDRIERVERSLHAVSAAEHLTEQADVTGSRSVSKKRSRVTNFE